MSARSTWLEREPRVGWDIYFTPLGGRLRSEEKVEVSEISDEIIRRFRSQAMIAVTPNSLGSIDLDVLFFCSIARKILQRGELPPVPTEVETELKKLITPLKAMSKEEVISAVIGSRKSIELDSSIKLDPSYEVPFWELANKDFPNISAFMTCQASLQSLTDSSSQEQWTDFLLYGPWNAETPRVIEIDGDQHRNQSASDTRRDDSLRKHKIESSRILGVNWETDAQKGFEHNLKMLPPLKFNLKNAQSLFGPSVSTRIGVALVELLLRGHIPKHSDLAIVLKDDLQIAEKVLHPILNFLHRIQSFWGILVLPKSVLCNGISYSLREHGYTLEKEKNERKRTKVEVVLQHYVSPQAELLRSKTPSVVIRGAFLPVNLEFLPLIPIKSRFLVEPEERESNILQLILKDLFGHSEFRENQSEAILMALTGKDSLVLLPTGSGKSLIYQMVGLLQPGTTLVVDPLTALIKDQIRRLNEDGIDRAQGMYAAALGTSALKSAAFSDISSGNSIFIFLSPERLHNKEFRAAVRLFAESHAVNTAVLDEAHCISEWGHDFRTAYLNVARNLRRICSESKEFPPTVLALTGTASPAVLRDVIREIKDPNRDIEIIKPSTYDRPNLNYLIDIGSLNDEKPRLRNLLLETIPNFFGVTPEIMITPDGIKTTSGIVFVSTVNATVKTQNDVVEVFESSGKAKNSKTPAEVVAVFAGKAPDNYGVGWEAHKTKSAHEFISNVVPILASTKAFGMGIDKPNIRWTIHRGFPSSLESFAQESGRAGRDGNTSLCMILASPASKEEAKEVLNLSVSPEERHASYTKLNKRGKDDLFTQLFFHNSSFSGTKIEIEEAIALLNLLKELRAAPGSEVKIPFLQGGGDEKSKERAIHRFILLGLIDDYTKQFNDRQFTLSLTKFNTLSIDTAFLNFMRRLEPGTYESHAFAVATSPKDFFERCKHHLTILIESVYRTIEPARIRALIEIQQICSTPMSNEEIRTRILAYLSGGPLATALEEIAETTNLVVSQAIANLNSIPSVDAEEWIGASARQLETYPDNPMLLAARGVGENGRMTPDISLLRNTLEATFATMPKYNIDQDSAAEVLMWLDEKIQGQIERPVDDDYAALSDAWEKSDFGLEPLLVWEQDVFKRALTSERWHNQLIRIGGRRLARRTEDLDSLVTRLKG